MSTVVSSESAPLKVAPTRGSWIALGALVVALLLLPVASDMLGSTFYLRFATRVLIFAIAGTSLNLILGYGGLVSFGHALFMGVGAYVVAILSFHVSNSEPLRLLGLTLPGTHNALIAWPLAILTCSLLGLVLGAVALRTTGLSFIMLTLAFAQMAYFFFLGLQQYGGEEGITLSQKSWFPGVSLENKALFYYVVLACLAGCMYLTSRLKDSRFGVVLQAARQNERRLKALGYSTYFYRLIAFAIAAGMGGLAGVLHANNEAFVSTADLDWYRSADLIIMLILGGIGTTWGPLVGAVAWLGLELLLEGITPHWKVILGPVLVLLVLFARGGIVSLFPKRGQ